MTMVVSLVRRSFSCNMIAYNLSFYVIILYSLNISLRWLLARPLPGANRLIKHLHKNGVPFALASNSLREFIDAKISHQEGPFLILLESWQNLLLLLLLFLLTDQSRTIK